MVLKSVNDKAFRRYGKVLHDYDYSDLLKAMEKTPCPDGVEYVASMPDLEKTHAARALAEGYFGGMPVQVGYCNGHNWTLNGLEYHRDSELNIAVTDAVLLVGDLRDITEEYTYDTSLVEAFFVPAGTAVALYATTLHYAPCSYGDEGFRVAIVLPRGTNSDLKVKPEPKGENSLLFAVNKWLLAHEEAQIAGAHIGLVGENIQISKGKLRS
jgi:hypothetical protein